MNKLLPVVLTIFLTGIALNVAAQEITLTIAETHLDGETSVSFDDGEYENDSIDKLDDDDLDMGWEGEDLNIMTSFLRFRNVSIPQGTIINSAILKIYAHEDEEDEAKITIYGEAIDDSPEFAETEALEDRNYTNASVMWDITEPWTMWEPYESPDLKTIIQEIVNRPNWASGNALTIFVQGQDQGASFLDNARDFESYENIEDPDDGGDGLHHPERIPVLVINYGEATATSSLNKEVNVQIFPNPSSTGKATLTFENGSNADISIFNCTGKLVKTESTTLSKISLDLNTLEKGVYLVTIATNNRNIVKKLIIE